jgi:hypothetical protein
MDRPPHLICISDRFDAVKKALSALDPRLRDWV